MTALFVVLFMRRPEPQPSGPVVGAVETPANAVRTITLSGPTMGTLYQVKVVTSKAGAQVEDQLAKKIASTLEAVNGAMSTYIPDSELSRFNGSPSTRPVVITEPLRTVLVRARQISEASGGAFDVTVGPLVNAWGFGPDGRQTPPSASDLAALRKRVGYQKLILDDDGLRKTQADVYVDLSAIAKGYGVDRVAAALEALGFRRYLVEIGGEVRGLGHNEQGRPWQVGIEKPMDMVRAVREVISLAGGAMATSGDYRNFYEHEGVRISHTVDPRTGRPITHRLASVTVLDEDCTRADAWATTLNVLGPEDGLNLAKTEGLAAQFLIRTPEGKFVEKTTSAFEAHRVSSKSGARK